MRSFIFNKKTGQLAQGKSWLNRNGLAVKTNALSSHNAEDLVVVEKTEAETEALEKQITEGKTVVLVDGGIQVVGVPVAPLNQAAIERVREYAEDMRGLFTGDAKQRQLDAYQINSDIINLVDAGLQVSELDPFLQQKLQVEVEGDERFTSAEQLIEVWRQKRGAMAVATAWVSTLESATIRVLETATTQEQIDTIVEGAISQAEAKKNELLGG